MNAYTLVGQSYVFEDGNKIEVIQVKKTEEIDWFIVTGL